MSLTIKIIRAKLNIKRKSYDATPSIYIVAKNIIRRNTRGVKKKDGNYTWNQTLPTIPNISNILTFFIMEKNVLSKDTEKAKAVLDLRWITLNNKPLVLKLPVHGEVTNGSLDVEITGMSKNYTDPTDNSNALSGEKLKEALKAGQSVTKSCLEEKHAVQEAENEIKDFKNKIDNENKLRKIGVVQKQLQYKKEDYPKILKGKAENLTRVINKLNFCKGTTGTVVDYGEKGLAGARVATLLGGRKKRRRRKKRKTRKKRKHTRRKRKSKRGGRRRRTKKRRR